MDEKTKNKEYMRFNDFIKEVDINKINSIFLSNYKVIDLCKEDNNEN